MNFEIGYGFQNAPRCNGLTKFFLYKKFLLISKVISIQAMKTVEVMKNCLSTPYCAQTWENAESQKQFIRTYSNIGFRTLCHFGMEGPVRLYNTLTQYFGQDFFPLLSAMFSNFSCRFLNPNNFFRFESQLFYFLSSENLQEQVKKAFCYQKLF